MSADASTTEAVKEAADANTVLLQLCSEAQSWLVRPAANQDELSVTESSPTDEVYESNTGEPAAPDGETGDEVAHDDPLKMALQALLGKRESNADVKLEPDDEDHYIPFTPGDTKPGEAAPFTPEVASVTGSPTTPPRDQELPQFKPKSMATKPAAPAAARPAVATQKVDAAKPKPSSAKAIAAKLSAVKAAKQAAAKQRTAAAKPGLTAAKQQTDAATPRPIASKQQAVEAKQPTAAAKPGSTAATQAADATKPKPAAIVTPKPTATPSLAVTRPAAPPAKKNKRASVTRQ